MPGVSEPEKVMSRAQLFQIRLVATATVLLIVYPLLRFLWFPGGYFDLSGIGRLLLVLAGVNLIVGPVLSTLVYRPGKRGLMFDLAVLAVLEILVLGWTLLEIHARRPAIAVFAVDRFELLPYAETDAMALNADLRAILRGSGPELMYAALPTDGETLSRLIDETVFAGQPDIDRRPEFWKPYPEGIGALRAAAQPLARLLTVNDERATSVRRRLIKKGRGIDDYLYLPIRARSGDGSIIIDAATGYPVDVLAMDPWPDTPGEAS